MSPTDFTDSHRLLACVCLNLPQISQILTDCWCAFVLIFYDFTDSVFFGGFPYLCKSVQSVGVFLSYAICGNFLSCAISGTFLSYAISGRNSLFRVSVYLAVYLIIYIVGVEIDEYT